MTELAEVIELLDVDPIGGDTFRGGQPERRVPRVFGGQVLGQALRAASRTVPAGRIPNSLHAYFIRPGDSSIPILFTVTRLRDGGSFSVRRVSAKQKDEVILEMVTSSCVVVDGPAFQRPMPQVPDPETLPNVQERLAQYADELDGWWIRPRPFDMRYITAPPRVALDRPDQARPASQLWLRPLGPVPNDPVIKCCLLAYVSDTPLLDSLMVMHRMTSLGPGSVASLDHAMWFHGIPDVDDWLLYDQHAPASAAQRGLASGYFHQSDGRLVCTVAQEGYLNQHAPRNWSGPRIKGIAEI